MTTRTATRRKQPRYAVRDGQAILRVARPEGQGGALALPIVDLSAAGISFAVEPGALAGLEPGARLEGVTVRVGDCEIRGELLVMHLTPGAPSRLICGALLYPRTDGDLVRLKRVLAGTRVRRSD